MLTRIITFYCFCDDLLKAIEYGDDKQVEMTTAEVMTVAFVAAEFFGGCFEKARWMLMEHGYIKRMLSKSRFNRRLHQIPEMVWRQLGYVVVPEKLLKGYKSRGKRGRRASKKMQQLG